MNTFWWGLGDLLFKVGVTYAVLGLWWKEMVFVVGGLSTMIIAYPILLFAVSEPESEENGKKKEDDHNVHN